MSPELGVPSACAIERIKNHDVRYFTVIFACVCVITRVSHECAQRFTFKGAIRYKDCEIIS